MAVLAGTDDGDAVLDVHDICDDVEDVVDGDDRRVGFGDDEYDVFVVGG
ncbi:MULTISPECIES: hypothetical protein [unclassified Pseudonocardia]|nr:MULTISPECIES: hypothetical protein [unclassified Pseudonocardia]